MNQVTDKFLLRNFGYEDKNVFKRIKIVFFLFEGDAFPV